MLFTQFQLSEWQTGMSAFGKRGGMGGGGRPNFGVAKPMKGGPKGAASIPGGDQFPPIDELTPPADAPVAETGANGSMGAAMDRLTARQNASGDQSSSKVEGFEASVHRIKEQVLPRLLERVDPEAAATLNKDELAEEFRPIISEVLTELKINLNRREQLALEKVLVDELLGLGPLEELLADPAISDIMVNGPDQTYVERKGKLEIAQIQFELDLGDFELTLAFDVGLVGAVDHDVADRRIREQLLERPEAEQFVDQHLFERQLFAPVEVDLELG